MRKLIDANVLIDDVIAWAANIRKIRDDGEVFFTEENIISLINKQEEIGWQDLT